jgi:hypothetical protein
LLFINYSYSYLVSLCHYFRSYYHNENSGATVTYASRNLQPGMLIIIIFIIITIIMLTNNKVFGPCRNPYDLTRTAGGSSGGEAALIASRGSFIGLGTDLGGRSKKFSDVFSILSRFSCGKIAPFYIFKRLLFL